MNNKLLLLVALSIAPVVVKAADRISKPTMVDAGIQTEYSANDAVVYLEHVANKPEPSFFKQTGKQVAIGFALALGGFIATTLVKKYFTVKAERYRDDMELIYKENANLAALEQNIGNLIKYLPGAEQSLENKKTQFYSIYNEEPTAPTEHELIIRDSVLSPIKGGGLNDRIEPTVSKEEIVKIEKKYEIANLTMNVASGKNLLENYKAAHSRIKAAQYTRYSQQAAA